MEACKLLCMESAGLPVERSKYAMLASRLSYYRTLKYTSIMAAWFYAQFIDVTAPHVFVDNNCRSRAVPFDWLSNGRFRLKMFPETLKLGFREKRTCVCIVYRNSTLRTFSVATSLCMPTFARVIETVETYGLRINLAYEFLRTSAFFLTLCWQRISGRANPEKYMEFTYQI